MLSALYLFSIFAFLLQVEATTKDVLKREKDLLNRILDPSRYDTSIRPPGENGSGPVTVHVNTFVRSISNIDDVNMEFAAQLTFRQSWLDSRLKYNKTGLKRNYLTLSDPHKIWIPDLFFRNEKTGHFHDIITPNVLIRITPDGKILYSTRISMKLSCPMDLRNYPMDKQMCSIQMASYGYTTDDLTFIWKDDNPVQMTKNLNLPKFNMDDYSTGSCTSRTTTGEYSCLTMDMHFTRALSYYFLQVYAPTTFLVLLSWISFFLDHRATTARVAIWVTVLLTLTIHTSSIQSKLPAVSYTKAVDVWLGVCLAFLFAALIELVLIAHSTVREESLRNQAAADEAMAKKPLMGIDDHADRSTKLSYIGKVLRRYPSKAQKIDVVSRVLFPVAFAFFNLIYWASYAR